jgi:RNA polymerase sigma-70 factor (ECF subfamily)
LQESAFGQLLDDDIATAIAKLPEDFRTVVILCDIEGLTYEEIAEFLAVPLGTVRSRLHRGRSLLREKLLVYAKDRGYTVKD